MKSNSTITSNSNSALIFFSALGLGYSIVKYFITEKSQVIPLFIISLIIFSRSILPLFKNNKS